MFTYHYCAKCQIAPGEMGYMDGVVTLKTKVKSTEDYRDLKMLINSEWAFNLTITSLSLI